MCYHGVGDSQPQHDPHFHRVSVSTFKAQLELLLETGYDFLTVSEFAARITDDQPPPASIALSFDDGMADNHDLLLPILGEYRLPASIYVATGLIGKPNPWLAPESGARMMSSDELRDVAQAGVELGAHTSSHPNLSQLDYAACLDEMTTSRDELESITASPVRTFAYPYFSYGPSALEAAQQAGFDSAVAGLSHDWSDPLRLPRVPVTGKDGILSFALKLIGAYQPMFDSLPGRLVRSSTRGTRHRMRQALGR